MPSHPSRPTNISLFLSDNFKEIKIDQLPFTQDPHSWKWYFACGKRFLIVGLGVSRRRERESNMFIFFYLEKSDLFLGHEGSKGLTQPKVRVQFYGTTKRNYIGS